MSAGCTTTGFPVSRSWKTMARSSRTTFSMRSTRLASRASSGSGTGIGVCENAGAATSARASAVAATRKRGSLIDPASARAADEAGAGVAVARPRLLGRARVDRLLLAVGDRGDAVGAHALADQDVAHRVGATGAQR